MSKARFLDNPGVSAFGSSGNSLTSTSASYAATATSASYAVTASHALFAVSASHEIVKEVSSSHANTADVAGGLQGQPSISVTNITASSNISSSGTVTGLSGSFSELSGNSPLTINGIVDFKDIVNVSGSVDISGSLNINGNPVITGNQTGSYATTGSNNFIGNQTITGSIDVTGSLTVSGSGTFTNIGPFSQTGNSIFTGNITASANVSSSATSTASFGTYLGDGSQLSGISSTPFPFTGDAQITGSLTISGSFNAFRINTNAVMLGEGAGELTTVNGPRNVFVGYQAGYSNTIGDDNVAIGYQAGYGLHNNASDANIFVGKLAGGGGTSGAARMSDANSNIGIGGQALLYLSTGDSNIAIGASAMRGSGAAMSATQNIALGVSALFKTDSGDNNIGIGYQAGLDQTTGDGNITIGSGSLGVAGESNQLRIGNGNSLVTISGSLATGDITFASTASAAYFVGDGSQLTNLPSTFPFTGDAQITGSLTISGSFNSFIWDTSAIVLGEGAGASLIKSANVSEDTVIIGSNAANNLTYTDFNTVIGANAGRGLVAHQQSTFLGYNAGRAAAASRNTAVGADAGYYASGLNNAYLGYRAGYGNSSNGDQAGNVAIGAESLYSIYTGDYNIGIGYKAGYNISTGTGNIIIGSGSLGETAISNQLRIGNASLITISASLTTGDILLQGDVSSSATSTASFGTYLGDGSQLSGISAGSTFPFTGDAVITGSLVVSSSNSTASLTLEGSGSTVFEVLGSVGTLFSVDDSLTGTVFSANDISGLPVLQADATGEVYLGKSPQSLYTTATISSTTANITQSIYGLSTSSYEGVFVDYTATSASNARAGNITAIWNGSSLNFAETTTTDIGDTSNLIMQIAISQSQAQVQSYSTAASYKIKTIIRSI